MSQNSHAFHRRSRAQAIWSVWTQLDRDHLGTISSADVDDLAERLVKPRFSVSSQSWPASFGWKLTGEFLAAFECAREKPEAKPTPQKLQVRGSAEAEHDANALTDQLLNCGLLQTPLEWRFLNNGDEARCALLSWGGIRIYAPEPTNVAHLLVLVHEIGHAILASQRPSSLSDFVFTESHALALEMQMGHWLARVRVHPCTTEVSWDDAAVRCELGQWLRSRRYQWRVSHLALSRFEARLARACLQGTRPPPVARLDSWWRYAHSACAVEVASAWAQTPGLWLTPGCFRFSFQVWRTALALARRPGAMEGAFMCRRSLSIANPWHYAGADAVSSPQPLTLAHAGQSFAQVADGLLPGTMFP